MRCGCLSICACVVLGLGHSRLTCRRLLVYISSFESRAVLFAKNYFVFNSHFWFVYSITFINISGPWAEFNGPFSWTTQVSQYQKGKTNLDFTEARDSEWQWCQLGFKQVCTSLQTDNHASTPPLSFYLSLIHI